MTRGFSVTAVWVGLLPCCGDAVERCFGDRALGSSFIYVLLEYFVYFRRPCAGYHALLAIG